MTEPIAVDVPAKPSFSRSGPGLVPGLLPVPVLAPTPAPKVEAAPKPAPAVAAVAPTAAGVPPIAPATGRLLSRFTKKQLTAGLATLSLFAGIGTVRMMFPAKDDPKTSAPVTAAVDDKVKLNPPLAAPINPPALQVEPPTFAPISTLPPVPTVPVTPVGAPPAAKITGFAPVLPPAIPDFSVPPPTGIVPIGGNEFPKVPAAPVPGGGISPLPAVPATPLPPLPGAPTPPFGGGLPGVPPPSADLIPKPPLGGATPVLPANPFPPLPGGSGVPPVAPDLTPKLPALPDAKPPATVAPDPFPIGAGPKTDVKLPPPPDFTPPALGTPTGFTKPAGTSEVKPVVPEFAPRTTFDVDVYDPRANDTYESISLDFYNDRRFAVALKAFNQNAAIQGGRYVNVPPIHVLKRQFPAQTGGAVVPVGGFGVAAPSADPVWGAASKPVVRDTFTVPPGAGMTLPQVARQVLGTEQRWRDIYDLNPQVTKPSELLPAGTQLKLP